MALVDTLAVQLRAVYPGIMIVRESVISPYLFPLLTLLLREATLSQLDDLHPLKVQIKARVARLYLIDYLFPIHQAAYMTAVAPRLVRLNDDNLRFVLYANKLARRINRCYGARLKSDLRLDVGDPPRLLGSDYEKASYSRNNCVSIFSELDEFDNFAKTLVHARNSRKLSALTLPKDFLPFVYLKIFCEDDAPEIENLYREGQIGRFELAKMLASVLYTRMADFRYNLKHSDHTIIAEYLSGCEETVAEYIQSSLAKAGVHG